MRRDPERLHEYLAHIIQASDRIERYTSGMDCLAFLAVLGGSSRNCRHIQAAKNRRDIGSLE